LQPAFLDLQIAQKLPDNCFHLFFPLCCETLALFRPMSDNENPAYFQIENRQASQITKLSPHNPDITLSYPQRQWSAADTTEKRIYSKKKFCHASTAGKDKKYGIFCLEFFPVADIQ
jgi:hypothetical protein